MKIECLFLQPIIIRMRHEMKLSYCPFERKQVASAEILEGFFILCQ
jgi:hypothetical protein